MPRGAQDGARPGHGRQRQRALAGAQDPRAAADRPHGRRDAGGGRNRSHPGVAREASRDPCRHADRLLGFRPGLRGAQGRGRRLPPEERVARRDSRHRGACRRRRAHALGRDRGARAARVRARAGGGALPRAARRTHRTRGGDTQAARDGGVEPRDREAPLHQRADGQEPRREHLPEAAGQRSHQGRAAGREAGARRHAAPVSGTLRAALRGLTIAAGVIVALLSVLAFRLVDWPIYVAFVLLSLVLFRPYVEMPDDLILPMPGLALTIGFLYLGGLPIITLRLVESLAMEALRWTVPARWRGRVASVGGAVGLAAVPWRLTDARARTAVAAEWGVFGLGLAVRWWVVRWLVPGGDVTQHAGSIAVAEAAGYAVWGLLALLPIFTYRPFLPPIALRQVFWPVAQDLGLIFVLALTPFVFLIVYGYATHGLTGAIVWSLSSLGLHFMLKRLTERRLAVEEQNRRLTVLNRELEHRERLA